MNLSKEDGKDLIVLAKESISSYFKDKEVPVTDDIKKKFPEESGAFVTLMLNGELRGCIGFTEAMFPLWETIVKAAQSAAFSDPRFMPLTDEEFKNIKVEVSVLTKPELIEVKEPSDYKKEIEIGKHGLIAEKGINKGLLLPQVFTDYKVNWEKALEMTCQKAGLSPDAWKDSDCKIFRFSALIFSEE